MPNDQEPMAQPEGDPTSTKTYAETQLEKRRYEKGALAAFVTADLIKPETAIFLDAGSTVTAIARAIFARENSRCEAGRRHEQMKVCIVTNNMMIFQMFNERVEKETLPGDHSLSLVMTGGEYDRQHEALFGCVTEASLDAVKCHISVIGTSGLTFEDSKETRSGIHSHALTAEKVTKAKIIKKKVEHRIIVCDHSKIGREDTLLCGTMEQVLDNTDRCTIVVGSPWFADYFAEKAHGAGYDRGEVEVVLESLRRATEDARRPTWAEDELHREYFSRESLRGLPTEGRPAWVQSLATAFDEYKEVCDSFFLKQSERFRHLSEKRLHLRRTDDQREEGCLRLFRVIEGTDKPDSFIFGRPSDATAIQTWE